MLRNSVKVSARTTQILPLSLTHKHTHTGMRQDTYHMREDLAGARGGTFSRFYGLTIKSSSFLGLLQEWEGEGRVERLEISCWLSV